eukprot:TCONS_00063260-protein
MMVKLQRNLSQGSFYTTILLMLIISTQTMNAEKPSAEVIEEIKKIILLKIGVDKPPPPDTSERPNFQEQVKAQSIRTWRRNTRFQAEHEDRALSKIQAKPINKAGFRVFSFKSEQFFQKGYAIKSAKLTFIPGKDLTSKTGPQSQIEIQRRKIVRYTIDALSKLTVVVDIKGDIDLWKKKHGSKADYRLKFKCSSKVCIDSTTIPFIDLEYRKISTKVKKSSNPGQICSPGGCCRKTVTVSIKDLGWSDWFFMPESFDYHYCVGTCSNMQNSLYFRLLKSLNSSTCCAPTELTGMRALYRINKLVHDRYIKNLTPKACACGGIAGVR